jgi:hypothetical protein
MLHDVWSYFFILIFILSLTYIHTHTYIHIQTHTHTYTRTYTHIHTHTHTNTYTYTHTCTHTFTHETIHNLFLSCMLKGNERMSLKAKGNLVCKRPFCVKVRLESNSLRQYLCCRNLRESGILEKPKQNWESWNCIDQWFSILFEWWLILWMKKFSSTHLNIQSILENFTY